MLANKPIIGISTPYHEESRGYRITHCYGDAVVAAGGIAVMLPAANSKEDTERLLPCLDGILIPGGPDVDPFLYGEEPKQGLGAVIPANDQFEIHLIRAAREAHKPILCVCRGIQVLNVAFGGTLYQDLPSQLPESLRHSQIPVDRREPTHTVDVEKDSYLFRAYGKETIRVNSFHHQAVKDVAPGFTVSARARDGLVEAIEICEEHILGVQWHPEEMVRRYPEHLELFRQLVRASSIQ